jgi:RHS repeat-associated protein
MDKKSGVGENNRSNPGSGGGIRSIGDAFQPNLAMGGGSYKIPIELPAGPGGFAPKFDLVYDTGAGNGPFGQGWTGTVPFIERKRKSAFAPQTETEYTLAGAETLVPVAPGEFISFIAQSQQRYLFDGSEWRARTPDLTELRFGSDPSSQVAGLVDGSVRIHRWLLDRMTFPGNRNVDFLYESVAGQAYLKTIRWSVFRLEFLYEDRPDSFSQFDTGFEIRTIRRCHAMELYQDRLAPHALTRRYELEYETAEHTQTSLLRRVWLSGFRFEDGATKQASLPPLVFTYTKFSPDARNIVKFSSDTIVPPSLGEDVTLVDLRGTSLPGVLRLSENDATYWENRGALKWGPPQRLPAIPQSVSLSDPGVRFADMTGRGTADLVVGLNQGGGYYPNDPERGFQRKQRVALQPSFDLGEEDSYLIDIDGDRVADLLTTRNGTPMVFFNQGGREWSDPVTLADAGLPRLDSLRGRLRFADMNGDGNTDAVLLYSRQIVYWPYLGNGKWGHQRVMQATPEFDVPRPEENVYLADVNGDGAADLILVGNGFIRIYLNQAGEAFSNPIVLERTPRLGSGQVLLADMTGSGTSGFLFTSDSNTSRPHQYWFLDLLNGVKPSLLNTIDNSAGLVTTLEYSTSARERADDLAEGVRWSGYLPFVVPTVKRMTLADSVTGQQSVTEFRFHDGHYDGHSREYLGFARVDSLRKTGPDEDPVMQRYYFHNRATSRSDPAFLAGKGQPHRTELINSVTGQVHQVEESDWEARVVPGTAPDCPAYLALQKTHNIRHLEDGVVYEHEDVTFQHNDQGGVTQEHRLAHWTDSFGTARTDELIIETSYAEHVIFGPTSYESRVKKLDGAGRVLKHITFYYDGPEFAGLPFGKVENGFKTRQTEIALTKAEIDESYGGTAPAILGTLYRSETDPELGPVFVKDIGKARFDAFGNQTSVIDSLGLETTFTFDAEFIHPVSMTEGGEGPRELRFDPIAQQISRAEDLNGNVLENKYDGLGNVIAVYKRGATPGLATETYEFRRHTVPNATVQRIRINANDAEPGYQKIDYFDGCGRICQSKLFAENGQWAVGKQEVLSIHDRPIAEHDAYFSTTPSYDTAIPAGVAVRRLHLDFASRVTDEILFNGRKTKHHYFRNEIRFFGPAAADSLAADPGTPPTRVSRMDARGLAVSIIEQEATRSYEQRREYDALQRMVRIIDSAGHVTLQNSFDLWGNKIKITSAEAGTVTFVFNAKNNEVVRTDADGRVLYQARDLRNRITELRTGGPSGPIEETYSYDAGTGMNLKGRLAQVKGGFGEVNYSYSVEGDPVEVQRTLTGHPSTFVTRFTYNQQRKVTRVQYPDGAAVDYNYSPPGMLASIPGYINSIEYGPTGKRTRIVYANGVETKRGFTPGDYLMNEVLTQPIGGASRYQHLIYHLDGTGQVTQIDDQSSVPGKVRLNQSFTYDSRNRLVHSSGSFAGYDFEYRYDELGNMVFCGESFRENMDYGFQAGDIAHPNRLVKRHSTTSAEYVYDASGNLTKDPALGTLSYDARHRLVRIQRPNGSVVDYVYDHNDRRVKSVVTNGPSVTERYEVEGIFLLEAGSNMRIVFDEDRRLAVVPAAGDTLVHHLDRLGNVNVVTNLSTGAFVGHDEYTPYGRLLVSMVIEPAFTFRGGRFTDGLDIVLLGARYYRPVLGRFLTSDPYLIINQDKIPALLTGANLYLYAYCNPTNFVDPTGEIAPLLVALIIAAIVGAIIGAAGAAANGAKTWDEWLVWIVGGIVGACLTVLGFYGLGFWLGAGAAAGLAAAKAALIVWAVVSLIAVIATPLLDMSDSKVAWVFSWILKLIKSPITTILGLLVVAVLAIAGKKVDFRRGAIFVEVGSGNGALTLGSIVYTQSSQFDSMGKVNDNLAKHEAYHTRTVAAIGEIGFYVTYLTLGGLWGLAQGGSAGYLGLDSQGCGNPFEKTAYTYYSPYLGGPGMGTLGADSC